MVMDVISQQLLRSVLADLAQRLKIREKCVRKNTFSKTCTQVTKMRPEDDFEAFLVTLECIQLLSSCMIKTRLGIVMDNLFSS